MRSHLVVPSLHRRLPILSMLAATVAFACSDGGTSPTGPSPGSVVGSGNTVTEVRSVTGVNRVSIGGVGTLNIEQTGFESLTITANDNILPLLASDVVDGLLTLGPLPGTNIGVGQHFVYELTVVDLDRVSVGGVNTVEFTRIDSPLLRVDLAGVTNMTSVGTADEQRVDIGGVTTYRAGELESKVVRITAAGVATATLRVSERLDVDVSLTSTVQYFGDPVVNKTGAGTVRRLGG